MRSATAYTVWAPHPSEMHFYGQISPTSIQFISSAIDAGDRNSNAKFYIYTSVPLKIGVEKVVSQTSLQAEFVMQLRGSHAYLYCKSNVPSLANS
ncbi:hypothetical protein CDAR_513931 [Caerostris darwini]|uniref:Uncharacterized protein n=1 Tax=Caerostris darwini TaxID=1538125 RepID=A0AAV4V8V5_9ARAC|nr:hypothetical protein CDAR_513931 [Caerostris darwini]